MRSSREHPESRERVGGQSICARAALPRSAPGPGPGSAAGTKGAQGRPWSDPAWSGRGAMEAAADSTRFGYILELLRRDKVGTASGTGTARGGQAEPAGRDRSLRQWFVEFLRGMSGDE